MMSRLRADTAGLGLNSLWQHGMTLHRSKQKHLLHVWFCALVSESCSCMIEANEIGGNIVGCPIMFFFPEGTKDFAFFFVLGKMLKI